MKNSIAYKYLGVATSILVIVQLSLGFWQSRWHYLRQLNNLEQKISNKADFLSAVSIEAILNLDFLSLENLMEQATEDEDILYSIVINSKGQPLTRFLDKENHLIKEALNKSENTDSSLEIVRQLTNSKQVFQLKENIIDQDRIIGEVLLGYSHHNIKWDLYRAAFLNIISALIVSTLLATITLVIFNSQVSNPLKKLTNFAEEIAAGKLKNRVKSINQASEIGLLEDAFNQMATQLEETIAGLHNNNRDLAVTNAQLARATKLKDEFLANMSHELRTPLNAILGLSEALLDEVYGTLTQRQSRSLNTIHNSGKHLLSLINGILDLAKIESGKEELYLSCVELSYLCKSSIELVKELALKKNLQIEFQLNRDLESVVLDERKIKQVLINLLTNAIKFTLEGGKVTLKAWLDSVGKKIFFQVTDTGIGIKSTDMDKLFESFVQIESSLSRTYEGTGLGLALVKNIIELHGGSINVCSEVGKGSEFTVVLPWQKNQEEEKKAELIDSSKQILPTELSNAFILIAEDNETNILTFSDYLSSREYKLVFANNGAEAIEIAKEKKPDLILMDIQMPKMDGIEATRKLKQDKETASIPIIALTSLSMPGDREKCLAAGANEYLTKPVNLERLVMNIEEQISNSNNKNSTISS